MEYSKEYLKMAEEAEREVAPGSKPHVAVGPRKRVLVIAGEKNISDTIRATITARRIAVTNGTAPEAPTVVGTGKKVKHVFIEATFPELKGGASRQSAHGEASGTKPAIARAFKNLLKTIPKKRISVISAKISITTKIVEGDHVEV